MPALTTTADGFLLRGDPFRIISGALHYFRVHPDQWADRLHKARLMGLNTVETYIPWNLHQPRSGAPLGLDGILDLPRFLRLAAAEGLHVLLRPGPYICAEWDGGGLPAWLTADDGIRPRSTDPRFTAAVDAYLDLLLPPLLPHMAEAGGPVIAVQVENEYGAYGEDTAYLEHLEKALRGRGVRELLFTCDQADPRHLAAGALPGALATGTFGGGVERALARMRDHRAEGPLMCAEFWIGWFDHWGGPHHVRDAADAAADLDRLLSAGASVNIYMFHGGTNFGLTNGANHDHAYAATVTSYDYDAPLTEHGDPGPKYHAFREVIARHAPVPDGPAPGPAAKLAPRDVVLDRCAPLFSGTASAAPSTTVAADRAPLPMDRLDPPSGFALYRSALPAAGDGVLRFSGGVGDRAQVFVDGAPAGVLERERGEEALTVWVPRAGAALDVLVEDLGGTNYGPRIGDRKGLLGPVAFEGAPVGPWTCRALPPDVPEPSAFAPTGRTTGVGPAFHRGTFEVEAPADAFLALPSWTKGLAWVNGFALGRYWRRGPQRTLYVPGPVLRTGANDLVLFELHGSAGLTARLTDAPDLGPEAH
ncbi:glycoside hydrolase family 35 protein [Nocardiopsis suaedae]|uniref:Beta-galactosidase n=1 Tax=Nocardiopsis suaedae TaxID=3018444 RepID=A0ABT4TR07_9ACTN|nr:beta-galactosidase family protein [Nocardiopsis suaedae]MDA2807113.1 beta-galactosidase [Nocardiopsis suaedae]